MTYELRQQLSDHWHREFKESGSVHQDDIYCTYFGIAYQSECSPAERLMWCELRSHWFSGGFVPEFKVGRYFIDFADLKKKVGIEVDGKEYHEDWERDAERDAYLRDQGWKIYRLPAKALYRDYEDAIWEEFNCRPWDVDVDKLRLIHEALSFTEATCFMHFLGDRHYSEGEY